MIKIFQDLSLTLCLPDGVLSWMVTDSPDVTMEHLTQFYILTVVFLTDHTKLTNMTGRGRVQMYSVSYNMIRGRPVRP